MKCPDCGSKNVVINDIESYCKECGLVLEDENIDIGKENSVQETAPPTNIFHPSPGSYFNPKEKNVRKS